MTVCGPCLPTLCCFLGCVCKCLCIYILVGSLDESSHIQSPHVKIFQTTLLLPYHLESIFYVNFWLNKVRGTILYQNKDRIEETGPEFFPSTYKASRLPRQTRLGQGKNLGFRGKRRVLYQRASYLAYSWLFGTITVCTCYFSMWICLFGNNLKNMYMSLNLNFFIDMWRKLYQKLESAEEESTTRDDASRPAQKNLYFYSFVHYLFRYPTRRETQCGQYNILCY